MAYTDDRLQVVKKDGRVVPFYIEHIVNDLRSADRVFSLAMNESEIMQISNEVLRHLLDKTTGNQIESSQVFQAVQDTLEEKNLKPLLAAFREFKDVQQEQIDDALSVDVAIAKFEHKDPNLMNENGNRDTATFSGEREALIGSVYKAKGLQMYPPAVRRGHIKGLIHLHDLDRSPFSALPNCSLPDFEYLLSYGFDLGNAHIRPPQSIGVAANLIATLMLAISGEQFGGISVHRIDEILAPYAEKSFQKNRAMFAEYIDDDKALDEAAKKKTLIDIRDAMQTLEYQINTMSSSSSQVPFTTVSFGLSEDWYGREIQKAILETRLEGMDGQTAIFPKLLFFVQEGLNFSPDDPNYDIKQLAMRCAQKRIYPDMIAVPRITELKDGNIITAMGCRSFLHPWVNEHYEPEIVGRNNLGVVSMNLPRIALQSEGDVDTFFEKLRQATELTLQALKVREDVVLSAPIAAAPIMYSQGGLGDPTGKESVRDFYTGKNLKRSSISVGYIGIHNAMVALSGNQHWHEDDEWVAVSHRIFDVIQEVIDLHQDEFAAMVTIYATPSESLCDRFARLDRQRFGVVEGVTSHHYYENSFHFPSDTDIDPFSKIHFESEYMKNTPGGFMFYVEAPDLQDNPKAFEALWDEAYHNVGYFGVNTPSDECFVCGFTGEFDCDEQGYFCPSCENRDPDKASVVRRLCGYLGVPMKRPVVSGKAEEIANRVKHC